MMMPDDVPDGLTHKSDHHDGHHGEKDFVGSRSRPDSKPAQQSHESYGDRRQQSEGYVGKQSLDRKRRVKAVLQRLKQVLQKHRPTDDETKRRIKSAAG